MGKRELKKIMYVEDDTDIQIIGKLSLEDVGGFSIHMCSSGVEVIRDIRGCMPDLILLDVMMPEMDGITTIKRLRDMDDVCNIPVVFMTAKAQEHELEMYRELGAVDIIKKPFDPMSLPTTIKAIWDKINR